MTFESLLSSLDLWHPGQDDVILAASTLMFVGFHQHAVTRDKNAPYDMMTNKQSKHRFVFEEDIDTGVTHCDMKMNDRRLANTSKCIFLGVCNHILLPGIRLIIS